MLLLPPPRRPGRQTLLTDVPSISLWEMFVDDANKHFHGRISLNIERDLDTDTEGFTSALQ